MVYWTWVAVILDDIKIPQIALLLMFRIFCSSKIKVIFFRLKLKTDWIDFKPLLHEQVQGFPKLSKHNWIILQMTNFLILYNFFISVPMSMVNAGKKHVNVSFPPHWTHNLGDWFIADITNMVYWDDFKFQVNFIENITD